MNNQAPLPYIPETITVHLGAPDSDAENVTVPFIDYIKNVASSEIYPTWPDSALRANIYAQISFALNRIYTEFYRSRGYNFNITNSTAFDQSFVRGRNIFDNVGKIVDEIFNEYIRRQGFVEPLLAQYCDGVRVSCDGLSQWGSVDLAEAGYVPYEILTNYYGDNIDLTETDDIRGIEDSFPTVPLRLGSVGNDVRTVQVRLNRISGNYPSIPKIDPADGSFSYSTQDAVRRFQEVFDLTPDGIVGKATWYKIQYIYNGIKRLNELDSEGLRLEDITKQYVDQLEIGNRGDDVRALQYYLDYLSAYEESIPEVAIDGIFGEETRDAVIAFQRAYGLSPTGIVEEITWNTLYNAYLGIISSLPVEYFSGNIVPFGGVVLSIGAQVPAVRVLQEYLNYIGRTYTEIPPIEVTGLFGTQTRNAVIAFQNLFGLEADGSVGAVTWNRITEVYSDLYYGAKLNEGQFPGNEISGEEQTL